VPCYRPQTAYQKSVAGPTGKRPITFKWRKGYYKLPVQLPCGGCIGCRLDRSKQWALRCVNEASQHKENCFITLTYRDADLPADNSLDKRHMQLFMKRLRKKCGPDIRFFQCGEYGDLNGRPHYHACLFNFDFPDKKLWKREKDNPLYTSELLEERWGLGFCSVGALTMQSSAYVARYILKKVTGTRAPSHYEWTDPKTGEIHQRSPEYATMSKGIGRGWIEKYRSDVYPHDYVVQGGKKYKPPRYYDQNQEAKNPKSFEETKRKRLIRAQKNIYDQSPARRKVRETVQEARLTRLPRNLGKVEK